MTAEFADLMNYAGAHFGEIELAFLCLAHGGITALNIHQNNHYLDRYGGFCSELACIPNELGRADKIGSLLKKYRLL